MNLEQGSRFYHVMVINSRPGGSRGTAFGVGQGGCLEVPDCLDKVEEIAAANIRGGEIRVNHDDRASAAEIHTRAGGFVGE